MPKDDLGPDATYRAIMDEIVEMTPSPQGARIRRGDPLFVPPAVEAPAWADDAFRKRQARDRAERTEERVFALGLGPNERDIVARLLDQERADAIFGVLSRLTWWMDCRGVSWSAHDQPMPVGYESGLHNDYVGRCDGWQWPARPAGASTARRTPERAPRKRVKKAPGKARGAR